MKTTATPGSAAARLIDPGEVRALDVLGPQVEFLTPPAKDGCTPCTMRGTIPPGVVVPLHSHADPETYVAISGRFEALAETPDGFEWLDIRPGDVFHVPGGAAHAFRNLSKTSSVMLIVSTARIGRFFQEVGTAVDATRQRHGPPSPETISRFLETAARYGYWNAPPEANARHGIILPLP